MTNIDDVSIPLIRKEAQEQLDLVNSIDTEELSLDEALDVLRKLRIYFEFDSYTLLEEYILMLKRVALILEKYDRITLSLEGRADSIGKCKL